MKIICGSRAYWKANNYSFFSSATGVTLAKLHTYTCAEYLLTYVCLSVNAITQAKPRKRAQNKDSDYVNVNVH